MARGSAGRKLRGLAEQLLDKAGLATDARLSACDAAVLMVPIVSLALDATMAARRTRATASFRVGA